MNHRAEWNFRGSSGQGPYIRAGMVTLFYFAVDQPTLRAVGACLVT